MTEDKSLQNIIEEYFKKNNLLKNQGIILEAGAYDGIEQSNTLFLENAGWKGVLVEPSFENYLKCISNRSLSTSVNCALVSPSDYNKSSFVFGDFDSDIMSSISATRRSALRKQKYPRVGTRGSYTTSGGQGATSGGNYGRNVGLNRQVSGRAAYRLGGS